MILRLGQPVDTTDGHFGEVDDIIVDPHVGEVTHVVAQPRCGDYQTRLVPMWLVTETDGVLTVQLDTEHLRRLERASDSDFARKGEVGDLGSNWDVGTEDGSIVPSAVPALDLGPDDRARVSYDRIPKGECEVRRVSGVVTCDQQSVGHVDGFLTENNQLTAIIVRVGFPGFRHDVLVPFGSVQQVCNDVIQLSLSEDDFGDLPRTDVLGETDSLTARRHDLQRRVGSIAASGLARVTRRRPHRTDGPGD